MWILVNLNLNFSDLVDSHSLKFDAIRGRNRSNRSSLFKLFRWSTNSTQQALINSWFVSTAGRALETASHWGESPLVCAISAFYLPRFTGRSRSVSLSNLIFPCQACPSIRWKISRRLHRTTVSLIIFIDPLYGFRRWMPRRPLSISFVREHFVRFQW